MKMENDNYLDEIDFSNQNNNANKSYFPLIAAVLLIIAAVFGFLFSSVYLFADQNMIDIAVTQIETSGFEITSKEISNFFLLCGSVFFILSLFPLFGAILSLKKKMWGFALGCAIIGIFSFGMFVSSILSIIAVILIFLSKSDFSK